MNIIIYYILSRKMMVHYVLENFKYAGYREEEAPSILEQIDEI